MMPTHQILNENIYRNVPNAGLLDKLDSDIHQNWIRLGAQRKPDRKQALNKQIAQKTKQRKALEGYERYNQWRKEEQQLRSQLQLADQALQRNNICLSKQQAQYEKLLKIQDEYINYMQKIRRGQELQEKIKKIERETSLVTDINKEVDINKAMNYLDIVDTYKKKVIDEKQLKRKQKNEITLNIPKLEKSLEKEKAIWERFSTQKHKVSQQINQIKAQRIASQLTTIKSFQQSSTESLQSNHLRTKNFTVHNKIVKKSAVFEGYWLWAIGLIIWAIFLLVVPVSEKIENNDEYCY